MIQYYLSRPSYKGPPVHFIFQLVDILLEKNYFRFEADYYLQTKGVSMGSSFAPSLANLFMARMEEDHILNHQSNPFRSKILMYWCFIDDCLCTFTDHTQLNDFLDWLNNIHASITFTMEGDSKKTHFLDTLMFRSAENKLVVKPYIKPTDRNDYLYK